MPCRTFHCRALTRRHRLADYQDAKVLLTAFISNHCPDSHAAESLIKQLVANMEGNNSALVAMNPNNYPRSAK